MKLSVVANNFNESLGLLLLNVRQDCLPYQIKTCMISGMNTYMHSVYIGTSLSVLHSSSLQKSGLFCGKSHRIFRIRPIISTEMLQFINRPVSFNDTASHECCAAHLAMMVDNNSEDLTMKIKSDLFCGLLRD